MRALLDTHILLWAVLEPERLPPQSRCVLEDPATELLVSAASAWEISTKYRLGKLDGAKSVVKHYGKAIAGLGAQELAVSSGHALKAGGWDVPHRDPFDRVLAAQSVMEGLVLISNDQAMMQFGVEVIDS